MTYESQADSIRIREDAHLDRTLAGGAMYRLIDLREPDDHRLPDFSAGSAEQVARENVWKAEYRALHLDPEERFVPEEEARDEQSMSEYSSAEVDEGNFRDELVHAR